VDRNQRRDHLRRNLLSLIQQSGDGVQLPSERELSERFKVARETLTRRHGAGTFASGQTWLKPFQLRSFSEDMRERGLLPSSRMLSITALTANAKLANRLRVSPGAAVLEVRRLRLADGMPMALETAVLSNELLPGFDPQRLAHESLYSVLEREFGIVMRAAAQQIQATVLSEAEAQLLDVAPFSPALVVERQVQGHDGRIIEYAKSLYRADRYKFEVNVLRKSAAEEG
jgi:GntR family transcriptional regulator